jgi:hypothetical protein
MLAKTKKSLMWMMAVCGVVWAPMPARAQDIDFAEEIELALMEDREALTLRSSASRSSAFRCSGSTTLGGAGDTFRRSDTRACSGARHGSIVPRGGFVPGVQGRTFVASITPCVGGRATLFTTSGQFVAAGRNRGGCPNGRATVDFCAPGGGGAVQLAQRFGEQLILQWQTSRGTECFRVFPRYTTRNGRCVPNRPGVGERGEAPLRGGVCR